MVMDKLREDFKEDYKFIDWFKSLSAKEKKEYLSKSDILEGDNDTTVLTKKKSFS